jgi:gas vesicle protein
MRFNNHRMSGTALAFAAGIGIGALIGLVFAPSSGEEMRENLAGAARDQIDDVTSRGRHFVKQAKKAVQSVVDDFDEAAAEGGRAYREAKSAAS